MLPDAKLRTAPRTRRASKLIVSPTNAKPGQRATEGSPPFPRVTLKATTPGDASGAGFSVKGSLSTCLAETLRLQAWAQRLPDAFEYSLRVDKARRIVRRAEDLTHALEELYRTARAHAATAAHASGRVLAL